MKIPVEKLFSVLDGKASHFVPMWVWWLVELSAHNILVADHEASDLLSKLDY